MKHPQIFTGIISKGVPNFVQPCDYSEIGKQGKGSECKTEHSEHKRSHRHDTEILRRRPLTTQVLTGSSFETRRMHARRAMSAIQFSERLPSM